MAVSGNLRMLNLWRHDGFKVTHSGGHSTTSCLDKAVGSTPHQLVEQRVRDMADADKEKAEKVAAARKRVGDDLSI